jgi:hypothetical protein
MCVGRFYVFWLLVVWSKHFAFSIECVCSVEFPRPTPVHVEWSALYVVIALRRIQVQRPRRKDQRSKTRKNLKGWGANHLMRVGKVKQRCSWGNTLISIICVSYVGFMLWRMSQQVCDSVVNLAKFVVNDVKRSKSWLYDYKYYSSDLKLDFCCCTLESQFRTRLRNAAMVSLLLLTFHYIHAIDATVFPLISLCCLSHFE